MKRILKAGASLLITATLLLALSSCSVVSQFVGEKGYFGFYKTVDKENVQTEITDVINSNVLSDENNGAYNVSYKYESTSKMPGHDIDYSKSYEIEAQIDKQAAKNEVYAYFKFKSFYEQDDGECGVDATVYVCIIKTGDGDMFSDYTLYSKLENSDKAFSGSFEEVKEQIEEATEDCYEIDDGYMKNAFEVGETGSSEYADFVLTWINSVYDIRFGETYLETTIGIVAHYYNKGKFLELVSSSSNVKFSAAGDNMFRVREKYDENEENYKEHKNVVSYLKINDDKTYQSKNEYEYERKTSMGETTISYETELTPRTEKISIPDFVK